MAGEEGKGAADPVNEGALRPARETGFFGTASVVLAALGILYSLGFAAWMVHAIRLNRGDGWGGLALVALMFYSMIFVSLVAGLGLMLGVCGTFDRQRTPAVLLGPCANAILLLSVGILFLVLIYQGAKGKREVEREQAEQSARYLATRTPEQHLLDAARERGQIGVIRTLVRQGVSIDFQGGDLNLTPLMCAIRSGRFYGLREDVQTLLELGASTEIKDLRGWTALHHACEEDLPDIAAVLLDHGADPWVLTSKGETPLALVLAKDRSGHNVRRDALKVLLPEAMEARRRKDG